MRLLRISGLAYLLVIAVTSIQPVTVLAQSSGLDTQVGILPHGSYDGGDIDLVSLQNGKLTLHIPLISYPQRGGKLKLDYALIYHNTGIFYPGCLPLALSSGCIVFPFDNGFSLVETSRPGGSASCSQLAGPQEICAIFRY